MKRKLFSLLLASFLLVSCFCFPTNAADPTPTNVTAWDYSEEFSGSSLSSDWTITSVDSGSYAVENDNLVITNTANGEYKFDNQASGKVPASKSFVAEFKLKTTFAENGAGTMSLFVYSGNGYRIHSQISSSAVKVRNSEGKWDSYDFNNSDGAYHTYRYQCLINDAGGSYTLFVDGVCLGTGLMNANKATANIMVINNTTDGNTAVMAVDYIKFAAVTPPAAPEATEVTEWTWEDTFEGSALDEAWKATPTDDCANSVSDGNLVMVNNVKGESKLDYTDIATSQNFVFETKFKAEFPTASSGVISMLLFTNSGYRIHSQIGNTVIKVRNADSAFDTYNYTFNDGAYHTVRYECEITEDGGSYLLFVDGKYIGSGKMHALNDQKLQIIANPSTDATMTTSFDYVRYAVLDAKEETPPDSEETGAETPDTGVTLLPAVLLAVSALAGTVAVSKKRR